uniref:Uncharacterized LOC111191182 n=1 Tax=Astyanax mexicanus TaxID=7994 RepID=A0A3B1ITE7_ASTMX
MDPHRSVLKSKLLNIIPAGRQLQRTPPSTPRREPTPGGDTHTVIKEETHTPAESRVEESVLSPAVRKEVKCIRRSSITSASANTGDADPDTFIQGMQGYQWTDADLEFIHQVKQQKQVQQLQLELSDLQSSLKSETQRMEIAVAARDELQYKFSKNPVSCEVLLQLCRDVLLRSCSVQLKDVEDEALLKQLQLGEVQDAVSEEFDKVIHLERELTKAQEIRY